uniref:Uncharacterized protein n=1 Tax=Octopus bimaculoides TaxID=37653 RepID=A0A0L8G9W3_OCTBM
MYLRPTGIQYLLLTLCANVGQLKVARGFSLRPSCRFPTSMRRPPLPSTRLSAGKVLDILLAHSGPSLCKHLLTRWSLAEQQLYTLVNYPICNIDMCLHIYVVYQI